MLRRERSFRPHSAPARRSPAIHSPQRPAARAARIGLGLFVVGQVCFIIGANLLPLLPLRGKHTALFDRLATPWSHLTGQWQGWALYSGVARQATFLCVDVHAEDGRVVRLLSANEPAEPQSHFRPFLTSRQAGYEFYLITVLANWTDEEAARDPEGWQRKIAEHLRDRWPALRAYLRWRLRQFHTSHPGLTARRLVLSVRRYRTPPPGDRSGVWAGPTERPLLRWTPEESAAPGCLPVEMCDPVTGTFSPLPRGEGAGR